MSDQVEPTTPTPEMAAELNEKLDWLENFAKDLGDSIDKENAGRLIELISRFMDFYDVMATEVQLLADAIQQELAAKTAMVENAVRSKLAVDPAAGKLIVPGQ